MATQEAAAHGVGTVRRLTCCCCGSYAGRFAQWFNRDRGYGVCRKCVLWMKSPERAKYYEGDEEFERGHGREGVNYANAEQWAEIMKDENP